jgi:hypothetical protein
MTSLTAGPLDASRAKDFGDFHLAPDAPKTETNAANAQGGRWADLRRQPSDDLLDTCCRLCSLDVVLRDGDLAVVVGREGGTDDLGVRLGVEPSA